MFGLINLGSMLLGIIALGTPFMLKKSDNKHVWT